MRVTQSGILLSLLAAAGCVADDGDDPGVMANAGSETRAVTGPICPRGATVQGIDVSHHQGSVDWPAVRASGRDFAIARISDGLSSPDSTFAANWSGMRGAGLIRGAYQYFRPGQDAVAQANMVVERVGRLAAGDLPVTLDVETTDGLSPEAITAGSTSGSTSCPRARARRRSSIPAHSSGKSR